MSTPGIPGPNRRSSIRRPPRGKARVTCLKGSLGLGRNLAKSLLDISETGARLILTAALARGDEVEVTLSSPNLPRPIRLLGNVIRSIPDGEGHFAVGVRFQKSVNYAELSRLI